MSAAGERMSDVSPRRHESSDYDPVTLKCRRCGMSAITGGIVCAPHPDYVEPSDD